MERLREHLKSQADARTRAQSRDSLLNMGSILGAALVLFCGWIFTLRTFHAWRAALSKSIRERDESTISFIQKPYRLNQLSEALDSALR